MSRMRPTLRIVIGCVAGALGIGVALPSLDFPFGRDQGLYYYVAREWTKYGSLPYRDVFEHKTPAIFLIYGLAIRLFGENMWGIRVLDLCAVIAMGVLAAFASAKEEERPAPETFGVGILGAAIFYHGAFDFWNTGQCEIWVCLAILGACVALRRTRSLVRASAASGLLCGVALLAKPPAIWLVCVCAVALAVRSKKRPLPYALFVAFAALPWLLTIAYFASKGGAADLFDVLVRANGHYVVHEHANDRSAESLWRMFDGARIVNPIAVVVTYAAVWSYLWAKRHDGSRSREPYFLALGLAVASCIAVAMQRKFYHYHFALIVAPGTLGVTTVIETLTSWSAQRGWPVWRAPAIAVANLVALFCLSYETEYRWVRETKHVAMHRFHSEDDAAFESAFRIDVMDFDAHAEAVVADWLRAHASEGDRVAVRGFEPAIYARSGLRFGGRFFWTSFLTMPTRAYRRDEWLAQDRADLVRIHPRFVVTLRRASEGPDSNAYFAGLGCVPGTSLYNFDILECPAEP